MKRNLYDPRYEEQFRVRVASGAINREGRIVRAEAAVRRLQVEVARLKRRYVKKPSSFAWIGR